MIDDNSGSSLSRGGEYLASSSEVKVLREVRLSNGFSLVFGRDRRGSHVLGGLACSSSTPPPVFLARLDPHVVREFQASILKKYYSYFVSLTEVVHEEELSNLTYYTCRAFYLMDFGGAFVVKSWYLIGFERIKVL